MRLSHTEWMDVMIVEREQIQALVIFLFIFPLFFQLSGTIFISQDFNFDAKRNLLLVPLPIASFFCFIGIAQLLRLEKKHFGMGVVFLMFVLMTISTVASTDHTSKAGLSKFILLVQFILPIFALVLGNLYVPPKSDYLRFEAIILYVLLIIIPLEMAATLLQGQGFLSSHLYIFSLYQHLEYLPVIFVGFYFLTVNSFYEKRYFKYLILFLAPFMGAYLVASLSMLAAILAVIGSIISWWYLKKDGKQWYVLSLILSLWMSFCISTPIIQSQMAYTVKYNQEVITQRQSINNDTYQSLNRNLLVDEFNNNLKISTTNWKFYSSEIFEDASKILFGHQARPEALKYSNAYNYYLDLVYHFGMIAILPLLYLIVITIRNCWQVAKAGKLQPNIMFLMVLVAFFVFVDNVFKVSFRQPYPGMMMFFLWGVLLMKLSKSNATDLPDI